MFREAMEEYEWLNVEKVLGEVAENAPSIGLGLKYFEEDDETLSLTKTKKPLFRRSS
jgi:hypothetical protein